jgi:hypothetical protein
MAGIAEALFGKENPFAQWANSNSARLGALGAGLASGTSLGGSFANAAMMMPQARMIDDERSYKAAESQKAEQQLNETIQFLRENAPDLAKLVDAGMPPQEAWAEAMRRQQPQSPELIEVNGQLVNKANGQVVGDYRTPDQPKPTSSMQEYEFARKQGYQGTFQDYELEQKRAGATNIDFNQNQGQAAAFADRMATANSILEDPKLTAAQTDMTQVGLSNVPFIGNTLTSEERKMAEQAQRDFVNAILRRESGAVISPSEFDNAAKQYFPQPGDTPAVIEQKRQNRVLAIQGVSRAAGPSYVPPPSLGAGGVVDFNTYFGGQ